MRPSKSVFDQPNRNRSRVLPRARSFKSSVVSASSCSLFVFCLLLLGCKSAHEPGGGSHASVQIKGKSLAEIQQATVAVFQDDAYRLAGSRPEMMVFDRPGSRGETVKWGSLLAGQTVVMRVQVAFRELSPQTWLLQADAYAVRNAGDPFFEDPTRTIILNTHPYQKLLDKVAKRLKSEA